MLLLAVVLLLTTPLTLLVAGGFSWLAAGKLVAATLLLSGWLWLRSRQTATAAGHRVPVGILCGYALGMLLVMALAATLTWLAGYGNWQAHLRGSRQQLLSQQTRQLLGRQTGPVRVVVGLAPSDERWTALERLLEAATGIYPRLSWRLANAEERGRLEKQYSLPAGSDWLLFSSARARRTALLGEEPEAALANGLAGLLGRRRPLVIHPARRGAPALLLTDGQFGFLAVVCLDLLPLLLLLLAVIRRQSRKEKGLRKNPA